MRSNKCRVKRNNHFCCCSAYLSIGTAWYRRHPLMHYWLTFSLFTTTPRSFSAALLCSQSSPQRVPLQVFSPCNSSCRTWHLSLLNSIRFPLSHSSSWSMFPLTRTRPWPWIYQRHTLSRITHKLEDSTTCTVGLFNSIVTVSIQNQE